MSMNASAMRVIADNAPATPLQVWFDGAMHPAERPQAPLTTHALHYGSGVFEGIRAYATRNGAAVFRLPEHLQRMQRGCEQLGLPFDAAEAMEGVLATLRANAHRDAYIRPLCWAGEGGFGLDVAGHTAHFMVATTASAVHLAGAQTRACISTWRRNPTDSLPPLKLCGGYVNSILAKREAKQRGFDEAIFLDKDGGVVECTGANLFIIKNGAITAVEHADALNGITRDTLIQITGAPTRRITLEELFDADEVFACGTAAEVAPIAAIEDRIYGDNPMTRELVARYAAIVRGEEAAYSHWLTTV